MMKMLRLALPLLLILAAPAFAQQTTPPPGNWEQLDAAQRELLMQPVRDRWNLSDTEQRQRMLDHARRWRDMPPEERAKARVGVKRFDRLSPEQQAQMRVLFAKTRDMSKQERRETFALYHAMRDMDATQRQALRDQWAKMSPEQREAWMRERAPRHGGHRGKPD